MNRALRPPGPLRSVPILLSLLLPSTVSAAQVAFALRSDDSTKAQVSVLMAQAEGAKRGFNDRKALSLYAEALALESMNADILWRMSRSYIDVGEHLPSVTDEEKEKQLTMYEDALKAAAQSISAGGKNSMAYTYHAIALSHVALFKGLWEYVGILKDIKADLEKAIALDSTNHLAYYSLGMACLKGSERPWVFRWPLGIGWANASRALKNLERAASLREDLIQYQLGCARASVESGDYAVGRAYLLRIPLLRTQDEDDEYYRRQARELFERIQDKE